MLNSEKVRPKTAAPHGDFSYKYTLITICQPDFQPNK